jgi:hypothetical protein
MPRRRLRASTSQRARKSTMFRNTGSLSLDYERMIVDDYRGIARINGAYVGPMHDVSYYHETLSPYALRDARAGVSKSAWTVYLFGTNVTSKRAGLTIDNTIFGWQQPTLTRFTSNQPPTIGLQYQTKL